MALWNAQQDPKCPWCGQYDTHTQQLLDCPTFVSVRQEHRIAVEHNRAHENLCWFPLPPHSPQVELLRQSTHIRAATTSRTNTSITSTDVTFYTDGCVEPANHR